MSILVRVVLGILSIWGIYMCIGFVNNLIYDIKYTKDKVAKFNIAVGTVIMFIVTFLLIWVTIFGPMPWM